MHCTFAALDAEKQAAFTDEILTLMAAGNRATDGTLVLPGDRLEMIIDRPHFQSQAVINTPRPLVLLFRQPACYGQIVNRRSRVLVNRPRIACTAESSDTSSALDSSS